MIVAFTFWSLLTIARYAVLFVGAAALAVWATRQPDQMSSLITRLRERNARSPQAGRCAPQINARPRSTEE